GLFGERVRGGLGPDWHRGAEDGDLALVARHDGRLAAHFLGVDQAAGFDRGDLRVVAFVLRPPGNVLDRAVAVVGVGGELLLVMAGEDAVRGLDGDPGHHRVGRPADGRPGGDPAADELVLVGADFHALAAA